MIQPLWRTIWRFLKKLKIELPYDPAIPLLGTYPEKTIIQKDTCKFNHKEVSAHTTQNNHQQKLQRINAEGAGKKYIPSTLSGT